MFTFPAHTGISDVGKDIVKLNRKRKELERVVLSSLSKYTLHSNRIC